MAEEQIQASELQISLRKIQKNTDRKCGTVLSLETWNKNMTG